MSNSFLNALLCFKSVINLLCCFQKFNKTLPQQEEQLRTSIKPIKSEIKRSKTHIHNKSYEQNNIKLESSSSQTTTTTTQTFANERNHILLNKIENEKPFAKTTPNMDSLKQTISKRLKGLTDSLKSKKRCEEITTDANSPLNIKKTEKNDQQEEKGKRLKAMTNSLELKTKASKAVITSKVANMAQTLKNIKRGEKSQKEDRNIVNHKHESYLHDEILSEAQISYKTH